MHKLFEYNHRFFERITRGSLPVMLVCVLIMGFMFISKPTNINLASAPVWLGYVLIYGTLVIVVSYMIDTAYNVYLYFKKPYSKEPTLKDRVAEVEKDTNK